MTRRAFFLFVLGFFGLWTAAWVLHQWLVHDLHAWVSLNIELAYWVGMKFGVWVIYPWFFWRRRVPTIRGYGSQSVASFIGLARSTQKRGYVWGMVTTVIWVSLSLVVALTVKHLSFSGVGDWAAFIYVITLTPIMEEIMFRGFILSGLQALGLEGKRANMLTTVLFLLVHCLGWAFQGMFLTNVSSTLWLSISLFSLVAGFVRIHSGSLRASIFLHIGNNTISGLLR